MISYRIKFTEAREPPPDVLKPTHQPQQSVLFLQPALPKDTACFDVGTLVRIRPGLNWSKRKAKILSIDTSAHYPLLVHILPDDLNKTEAKTRMRFSDLELLPILELVSPNQQITS